MQNVLLQVRAFLSISHTYQYHSHATSTVFPMQVWACCSHCIMNTQTAARHTALTDKYTKFFFFTYHVGLVKKSICLYSLVVLTLNKVSEDSNSQHFPHKFQNMQSQSPYFLRPPFPCFFQAPSIVSWVPLHKRFDWKLLYSWSLLVIPMSNTHSQFVAHPTSLNITFHSTSLVLTFWSLLWLKQWIMILKWPLKNSGYQRYIYGYLHMYGLAKANQYIYIPVNNPSRTLWDLPGVAILSSFLSVQLRAPSSHGFLGKWLLVLRT